MSNIASAPTFESIAANLAKWTAKKPNAAAITSGGETLRWRALHRRSNRIAHALEKLGVKRGDFVTIALPNGVGFIEACYGMWKLGAIPQPVSWRLPNAELKAIVELANPPVVIAEAHMQAGRKTATVADLLAMSDDEGDLPDCISPAWKAPTSGGSTGRPKLIVSGAPGVVTELTGNFWRFFDDTVALMPGPMYHNGPFSGVFNALQSGAYVVLMTKFDAEAMLADIAQYRATWLYVVPTMMSRVWRLPEETRLRYDMSSLKTVWHMAAPCPPWLKEEWIKWLGGEKILELYGGAEGQSLTVIDGNEWMAHRGSVGQVKTGVMKVLGANNEELPAGEVGEIYMKWPDGAAPTYRYIGANARVLPGGWESLGDIGWFDAEGYLYLADRRTDMILVGGSNVYPAEVEAALDEHPLVHSSAVIGLPDEDMGNRIHAIVHARGGLSAADLEPHLAERLVTYKRPRSFEFVDEPLRDDAGKVRRSALREARLPKK